MYSYALWLDHKKAYVYKFTEKGIEETSFNAVEKHPRTDQDDQKFYHSLTPMIKDANELLIMGPGVAKDEFKHHCENHHHANLAKKIVGVKTMESHPSKARMLEEANGFFKHLHMWTKNY
jgi:stalled ribosome rescue protein Dom34